MDCEEQLLHCLIEASSKKVRSAYYPVQPRPKLRFRVIITHVKHGWRRGTESSSDSLLEESGFEISVPLAADAVAGTSAMGCAPESPVRN